MSAQRGELVATDESAIVTESLSDAIVMEDGQSDGCLANPTDTNEGDRCEVFSQTENLLNQLVTSKPDPRRRGRQFTTCARSKYKIMGPLVIQIADLV